MRTPMMSIRQPLLVFALVFAAIFLGSASSSFADFPPFLVSGSVAYQGEVVDSDNHQYALSDGVLVLQGTSGGSVYWGTDLTSATSSASIGNWNGNNQVASPAGHTVIVPSILLHGTAGAPSVQIVGLNNTLGVPETANPVGSATVSGTSVFAYRTLTSGTDISNGFMFRFSAEGSKYYKYVAGPEPVAVRREPSWSPSTLFSFPQTIAVSGTGLSGTTTLNQTVVVDGLADCYWGNGYYDDGNGQYGELHVYIARDSGTLTGKVWGYLADKTVSTDWDPNSMIFQDDPSVSLNPQGNAPVYGPKYIAWEGALLEFAYTDYEGSDVYWEEASRKKVVINSAFTVMAADPSTTDSGSYDPASSAFSMSINLARVSDDRMGLLGVETGVDVITNGDNPGNLYAASFYDVPAQFWFPMADGGMLYHYNFPIIGTTPFAIHFSPVYGNTSFIDVRNGGWPPSDITWLYPDVVYVGGMPAPLQYVWDDWGNFYMGNVHTRAVQYGSDLVSALFGYTWNSGTTVGNVYGTWFLAPYYSDQATVTFDPPPPLPDTGPARFTWYGLNLRYRSETYDGGFYSDDNGLAGVWVQPGGSIWTQWPVNATGTFDGNFRFYPDSSASEFATFAMQDANGDLLGTDPGVVMVFGAAGGGTNVALGNGTITGSTTNLVYFYRKIDSSWGVKYTGIPSGALLIAKGPSGQFDSPVYRYTGSNQTISGLSGWAPSNLYPAQIYANGHYAQRDDSTLVTTGSGLNRAGSVRYNVINSTGGYVQLNWTWDATGFHSNLSGTLASVPVVTGSWDGGTNFTALSSGLTLSTSAVQAPNFGPAKIQWNGVVLIYDPALSTSTQDVYRDSLGLGLQISVGQDGTVTAQQSGTTVGTGTFDSTTKQFIFPASANVGTVQAATSNGFVINPPSDVRTPSDVTSGEVPGDLDIFGNTLTLGSWTDSSGYSIPGFSLSFQPGLMGQPSLLQFAAAKRNTDWLWSHSDPDASTTQVEVMRLDAKNRLLLYGTSAPPTPKIILDPDGRSRFDGPVRIAPQGDISMGEFTAEPPQP